MVVYRPGRQRAVAMFLIFGLLPEFGLRWFMRRAGRLFLERKAHTLAIDAERQAAVRRLRRVPGRLRKAEHPVESGHRPFDRSRTQFEADDATALAQDEPSRVRPRLDHGLAGGDEDLVLGEFGAPDRGCFGRPAPARPASAPRAPRPWPSAPTPAAQPRLGRQFGSGRGRYSQAWARDFGSRACRGEFGPIAARGCRNDVPVADLL